MRWSFSILSVAVAALPVGAHAQSFSSGSTGADGALAFPANAGLVYFNPANFTPRANNIYNFSGITIPAGTTVRLSGWYLNGPVYWLSSGDVEIDGTLDLTGKAGHQSGSATYRAPSEPGAGGYSGGIGHGPAGGQNPTPGNGPGGGAAGAAPLGFVNAGSGGVYTNSSYLVPLIGGSGGGGGCPPGNSACSGGGGGAGGGAILIASSTKITISATGQIVADGGAGNAFGGGGSGGAIRLVSNQISNSNSISANGGNATAFVSISNAPVNAGSGGVIRLEAFTVNPGSVSFNGVPAGSGLTSVPYSLALPSGSVSSLSVTSVNGTAINANPFTFPDTTLSASASAPVVISGTFIPPGTTGNLYIFSETTPDQIIPFTLSGTLPSTTASVNVTYPPGGSRGFAKVTWTQ